MNDGGDHAENERNEEKGRRCGRNSDTAALCVRPSINNSGHSGRQELRTKFMKNSQTRMELDMTKLASEPAEAQRGPAAFVGLCRSSGKGYLDGSRQRRKRDIKYLY